MHSFIELADVELSTILNVAYEVSPIVQQALSESKAYAEQLYADQQMLLSQNAALWTFRQDNMSLEVLQEKVLCRIESDLAYVQTLNQELLNYAPSEGGVTWSLATNKMENILFHAREIVENDQYFSAIVHGHFPAPFDTAPPFPVILGDLTTPYGNSQSSYLSAAIVEVYLTLQNIDEIQTDLPNIQDSFSWIDQSALAHVTPIPTDISLDASFVSHFSFYFSDNITPQGFMFIHSGYAFGGQRFETRYQDGKEFGPEDCSSWIAKLLQSDFLFSTVDQLYTYRMSLDEQSRGYVDPEWLQQPDAQVMQLLSPIIIEDPFTDIHAGQVFTLRSFENENHLDSSGIGGHTTLVLGMRENGNVVTLGYARNMPLIEGFGIQEFHWASTDTQDKMFFEVNLPALRSGDIFADHQSIQGLEPLSGTHSTTHFTPIQPQFYTLEQHPLDSMTETAMI